MGDELVRIVVEEDEKRIRIRLNDSSDYKKGELIALYSEANGSIFGNYYRIMAIQRGIELNGDRITGKTLIVKCTNSDN
jgi:hypothetical protein